SRRRAADCSCESLQTECLRAPAAAAALSAQCTEPLLHCQATTSSRAPASSHSANQPCRRFGLPPPVFPTGRNSVRPRPGRPMIGLPVAGLPAPLLPVVGFPLGFAPTGLPKLALPKRGLPGRAG